MDNYKKNMGQRLKYCRKNCHLTQEQVAEYLDVTSKHYSEVERGLVGLSVENLIKVSDLLSVSLDYLIKGADQTAAFPSRLVELYYACPPNKKKIFLELIETCYKLYQ